MIQAMTAHFLVFDIVRLNPGDAALVHAGAGGMGSMLIQMLKRVGAQVFTTVSTDAKAEVARGLGADVVINYTQQDFEEEVKKATGGQGVRIVYDSVGLSTFAKGMNCLGRRGCMALYGSASGLIPPVDTTILWNGSLSLTRPTLGDFTATREELVAAGQRGAGLGSHGAVEAEHQPQSAAVRSAAKLTGSWRAA